MGFVGDAMQERMMSMTTTFDLTIAEERTIGAAVTRTQTALAKTVTGEDILSLEDVSGAEVVALDERFVLLVMTERAS
jgi:hypothetical protein